MNIINQANSGLYSGVIAIWNTLQAKGVLSENELHATVSPITYNNLNFSAENENENVIEKERDRKEKDSFLITLSTWLKLGLFVKSNDGKISIAERYKNLNIDLKHMLFNIILSQENNNLLMDLNNDLRHEELTDRFNLAMVFVLSQDPRRIKEGWQQIRNLELNQFKNSKFKPFADNDINWKGFVAWCKYFNLCKIINDKIYFDFAPVIKSFICNRYESKQILDIDVFLDELSIEIPFFQQGKYWVIGRNIMNGAYDLKNNELNIHTSLALYKLDQENVIRLKQKFSDSRKTYILTNGFDSCLKNYNGEVYEISHIEIL